LRETLANIVDRGETKGGNAFRIAKIARAALGAEADIEGVAGSTPSEKTSKPPLDDSAAPTHDCTTISGGLAPDEPCPEGCDVCADDGQEEQGDD
jgi:hypothetical protein